MPISEQRTVLLATQVSIRPEKKRDAERPPQPPGGGDRPPAEGERPPQPPGDSSPAESERPPEGGRPPADTRPPDDGKKPSKDPKNPTAAKNHALRRLSILAVLFENQRKAQIVAKELGTKADDAASAAALKLTELALRDDWEGLRAMVSTMSISDFDAAVKAWLAAEEIMAKRVGDDIRDVAKRAREARGAQQPPDVEPARDVILVEFRDHVVRDHAARAALLPHVRTDRRWTAARSGSRLKSGSGLRAQGSRLMATQGLIRLKARRFPP